MPTARIPEATFKTLIRLVFSFALAVVIGTLLGVGFALNEFAHRSIRPLVVALQIVPFVAWVPIAVIWFGPTERAVVFVTVVGSFPSMTLATMAAMRQVPPILKRAGRTLGADGWTLYRDVILPAALPGFLAGLQQAWGFAWKALMAAELIIAAAGAVGLGHLLARDADDVPALRRRRRGDRGDRRARRLPAVQPRRSPGAPAPRLAARELSSESQPSS